MWEPKKVTIKGRMRRIRRGELEYIVLQGWEGPPF